MKKGPIIKKFNEVSPAGLGITKNRKYQYPYTFTAKLIDQDCNGFGQPYAKVGDLCVAGGGVMSASNVGRVIDTDAGGQPMNMSYKMYEMELMDGTTRLSKDYATGALTPEQVRELQDYYLVQEKRPERVKRDFTR